MKQLRLLFPMLMIILLTACSKSNTATDTPTTPIVPNKPLSVSLSKTTITADGFEEVSFIVKDQNNADVTSSSMLYINNAAITGTTFLTSTAGSYKIKAVKGSTTSDEVILTATAAGPSPFTQKTLAEMYTGTWCGICPGVLIPLDNYVLANPNTIMVGVHGPNGSGDPYQYIYDAQLRTAFGVSGVPTVLLNKDAVWNQNTAVLDALAQKKAPLGIAFETSTSGNTITAKTKVKFDVTTSLPLKLVVMLTEDSVQYNQANYGHYGLPNPIVNFTHRNILRSAATDIFGDAVPTAQQTKGNTWEKTFTLNATGFTLAKCKIVAFVVYDTNTQNRKGILNTQIVSAGKTKNFD